MALDQGLVGDVLCQHRLADAVRADQHDVGGLAKELERHQRIDAEAIAALGPIPVEVAERLEATDMSRAQPSLQAAAGALLLLPAEPRAHPGFTGDLTQCASSPCRLSAPARACCVSRSVITLILELIVDFQCMRSHR